MQSIYRFREAEVGLFLRAWERGVGPVALEPLRLTRNFRSQQAVVEWVNDAFARVLPRESDIASGAVSFEPAAAVHGRTLDDAVQVHAFVGGGAGDEAKRVVEVVEAIRAESPQASIALLVRARSHLVEIAAELRRAGLRPTAVELHSLANQPLISDLVALTRALEHLADRTAWLSVLRAPWCGLTLADLASLAEGDSRPVVELLEDDARLHRLSADGRARIARVGPVLQRAVELTARMPGADRVEQAWLLLGGPACLVLRIRARGCGAVLRSPVRARGRRTGAGSTCTRCRSRSQSLFAAPEAGSDPAFHVMTIHKAKGLEFDHVIVPRLGAKPRGDDAQLMVWLERAAEEGPELLLAPIHAGGSDKDRLLRWVESQLQQRQRHEDERLAYVAATRARHRLHWVGSASQGDDGRWSVPSTSLLARLWPVLQPGFESGRDHRSRRRDAAGRSTARSDTAPPADRLDAARAPADASLVGRRCAERNRRRDRVLLGRRNGAPCRRRGAPMAAADGGGRARRVGCSAGQDARAADRTRACGGRADREGTRRGSRPCFRRRC